MHNLIIYSEVNVSGWGRGHMESSGLGEGGLDSSAHKKGSDLKSEENLVETSSFYGMQHKPAIKV